MKWLLKQLRCPVSSLPTVFHSHDLVASVHLTLIGPFGKRFKFKEKNKAPVSAPNMEQRVAPDR